MNKAPEPLLPPDVIARRVAELAGRIAEDVPKDAPLEMVVVACGALVFAADLMRALPIPMTLDVVFAKSYYGRESSGSVSTEVSLRNSLKGRHVVLIDDILDSGRTLSTLVKELSASGPASLKTCVLLDKPSRRAVGIEADYAGFTIPDEFVVGYGLDDVDGLWRNLPYVGFFKK